jgi:hypothetical protein
MKVNPNLPVYDVDIDEAAGLIIDSIALVDDPAIKSNFIKLAAQTPRRLLLADAQRREVIGAVLIPELLIYRRPPEVEAECYIKFSADTIRRIAQVYMKNGYQLNLNMQHSPVSTNSYMWQSYIVDTTLGVGAPKGLDVPNGTWIAGTKIDDPVAWQEITEGRANGYSIEGEFLFRNSVAFSEKTDTFESILQDFNNLNKLLQHV